MCFVWTVLYLRLCAVIGLTFSVDGTPLDPSMPNACAYRKSEMVRVSKSSRRARTQMVKIRTANCTDAQSECFEYQPRAPAVRSSVVAKTTLPPNRLPLMHGHG
ncbi:hypothetical protein MRX96_028578 [Rhipicephalus microplus]